MRCDHQLMTHWIKPGSRVLDLGCGEGELLNDLKQKGVEHAYGVDCNLVNIEACLKKNIAAIQDDIEGDFLDHLADHSFDTVIIGLTLHSLDHPQRVLKKALRVGKQVIVSFINCGHYQTRLSFLLKGEFLQTYGSDVQSNIRSHVLSIQVFKKICTQLSTTIDERVFLDTCENISFFSQHLSNWFAKVAIYKLTQQTAKTKLKDY